MTGDDFGHRPAQHQAYRDQVWARRDEQASGGGGGGGGGLCALTLLALFGGFAALGYTAANLVQVLAGTS